MDEAEVADAPDAIKYGPRAVNKTYKYTLAVSPFDCMGCGVCVGVCPTNSLKMVARESQDDQQAVFDYCVAKVTEKPETTLCRDLLCASGHPALWRQNVYL